LRIGRWQAVAVKFFIVRPSRIVQPALTHVDSSVSKGSLTQRQAKSSAEHCDIGIAAMRHMSCQAISGQQ
jgi:hypothetical protein